MSIMQRLTLIGLYNYDNKLFDGLTLPEGYNKDVFIESLLIEHGEKLVLYSDLDFMKYSIAAWGRKWSLELTRIAEALTAEYNPIWNYDRYEEWNDKGSKRGDSKTDQAHAEKTSADSSSDQKTTGSASHAAQSNSSTNDETSTTGEESHRLQNAPDYQEKTTNEGKVDSEVEHKVSADNEGTYQPSSQDITKAGKQESLMEASGIKDDISERNTQDATTRANGTTDTRESRRDISDSTLSGSNKTDTATKGNNTSKTSDSESHNDDHVGHMWGNIGVTTSSQMIVESVEMRMKYNLYNAACRLFANELLIGIY